MIRNRPAVNLLCVLTLLCCLIAPGAATAEPATGLLDRYRQALEADPGNLTLHYLLGVAQLAVGLDAEALNNFRTAYPAYRDSLEANYNLALACLKTADLDSAPLYLEQAEALGGAARPELYPLADLYFNLALLAQERSQENEAIRFFLKSLALDPARIEVQRQLGDLYARRGETELAVQAFHRYLAAVPGDPISRDYLFALEFNRAQDLLAAGDLAAADRHFSAALEVYPDSPQVLYYLGYLAYRDNRHDRAQALLSQALAGDPTLQTEIRPMLYNIALGLQQAGQPERALQAAAPLADLPQADFKELFLAGSLNLKQRRFRQARNYLQRAVEHDASHAGAIKNLIAAEQGALGEYQTQARQALAVGAFAEAATALAEAERLQPDDPRSAGLRRQLQAARQDQADTAFRNARSALDAGDFAAAREAVSRGLELIPDDPTGLRLRDRIGQAFGTELAQQQQLAAAAVQQGDWAAAAATLQSLLALDPGNPQIEEQLRQVDAGRRQAVAELTATGQSRLDTGDPDGARTLFRQALALDPTATAARDGLAGAEALLANRLAEFLQQGRRAQESGRYDEARAWYDKAAAIDVGESAVAALAGLDAALAAQADALTEEAGRAAQAGQLKRADALYAKALQQVPDHAAATTGRTRLATRLTESVARYLAEAGRALDRQQYAEAMAAYREALDLAPDHAEALAGIRRVRAAQAGAVASLAGGIQAALDRGDLKVAEQDLAKLTRLDPYHPEARRLQARLEQLRLSGARPGDEQKLYLQGVGFYTQGNYAEAIRAWETVLTLDPQHEKARQNIEKTRRKLRQIEEFRSG